MVRDREMQPTSRLGWRTSLRMVLALLFADKRVRLVLALVVAIDLVLVMLDLGFRMTRADYTVAMGAYSISADGGAGESFEYVMSLIGAAALFRLAWRWRSLACLQVGLLFVFALADNALQIHEAIGDWGRALAPKGLLVDGHHFIELAFLTVAGIAVLALMAPRVLREATLHDASILLVLLLLACAAAFGTIADVLHASLPGGTLGFALLGYIEDGGELVFITLAGGVALSLALKGDAIHWSEAPRMDGV